MTEFNFGEKVGDLSNSLLNPLLRSQLAYPLDVESESAIRIPLKERIIPEISRSQSLTIPSGSTTFAISSSTMVLTGAAAVTIATISNGYNGQLVTLLFTDANITITNDGATNTDNGVRLNGTFTSTANDVLLLVRDANSWYEVARSAVASEWTDGGTFLYPADASGEEDIINGGTTLATADNIISAAATTVFNEQGLNTNSFRIETDTEANFLKVDAANQEFLLGGAASSGAGAAGFVFFNTDEVIMNNNSASTGDVTVRSGSGNGNIKLFEVDVSADTTNFRNSSNGTVFQTTNSTVFVNPSQAGTAFRVSTQSNANCFLIDGGAPGSISCQPTTSSSSNFLNADTNMGFEIDNSTITSTSGTASTPTQTRFIRFMRPTFSATASTTIADAATFYIENDPVAAGSVTITSNYAFWVDAGRSRFDGFINRGTATAVTIATGAVTITSSYATIDTEAAAATDDLDTINGGREGDVLTIRAVNSTRDVVAKDGTGNLKLAGDFTMDHVEDTLSLIYDGTNWLETARSNNNT